MNSKPDPELLARLIATLRQRGYSFMTPTPETHARVIKRPGWQKAKDLRGIFGWNLPFHRQLIDDELWSIVREGNLLQESETGWRSRLRAASLGRDLFLHSAYPSEVGSVFFGPDTYRFVRFITQKLEGSADVGVLIDVGTGAGAGAVAAARMAQAKRMILTDINPECLFLAQVNLGFAGINADFRLGNGLVSIPEEADLIIANPPFIASGSGRIYSDGGDKHGSQISLDWAVAGSRSLNVGGRLMLYTGAAIVDGRDGLRNAFEEAFDMGSFGLSYEELDPDIFGECIGTKAYADVERIAAVGAVITRRR